MRWHVDAHYRSCWGSSLFGQRLHNLILYMTFTTSCLGAQCVPPSDASPPGVCSGLCRSAGAVHSSRCVAGLIVCLWRVPLGLPWKIKQLRIGRLSSLDDVRLFRDHENLHGPHEFRVWYTAEPMWEQLESLTLRKQHQQAVQSLDEIRVMLHIQ